MAKNIIENELSGVFNWLLEGLGRLLAQRNFSQCEAAKVQLEAYKLESDSVQMFLEEEGWGKSIEEKKLLNEIYSEYKKYTKESGFIASSTVIFNSRLRNLGFQFHRKTKGNEVFMKKKIGF